MRKSSASLFNNTWNAFAFTPLVVVIDFMAVIYNVNATPHTKSFNISRNFSSSDRLIHIQWVFFQTFGDL